MSWKMTSIFSIFLRVLTDQQSQVQARTDWDLKQPWISWQIGPPQLQYKQSLYLTILQQSCRIYGK